MKNQAIVQLLDQVQRFLLDRYTINVRLIRESVILNQQVAEWRNNRLVIDVRNRGVLGSVCILCHVFGHLVQHSTKKEQYVDLWAVVNSKDPPLTLDEEFQSRYFLYEKEAYQIGKGLLEQVTIIKPDLENAYQAFMLADFEHYWRYLVTGKASSRRAFNRQFCELQKNFRRNPPEHLPSISLPNVIGNLGETEILVV